MAKLKKYYEKCFKCGVVIEDPQACNGKGRWLCCACFEIAEYERYAAAPLARPGIEGKT
jgi:hypothetical protein